VAIDISASMATFTILADAMSALSVVFDPIMCVAERAVGSIATDRAITNARIVRTNRIRSTYPGISNLRAQPSSPFAKDNLCF
jgi:hypothetical protein